MTFILVYGTVFVLALVAYLLPVPDGPCINHSFDETGFCICGQPED
ncbi:MAG: hypothetical protein U0800_12700 [Isosphaeraceae bacterium]